MDKMLSEKNSPFKNKKIFNKYKITNIIGKGSFGNVYKGINIQTKELVAIKVESKKSNSNLLKKETHFLSMLKGYGFPKIISYGYYGNYNIMIQELLGFNLLNVKSCIQRFTIKDLSMMGIQIMDRIEFLHSKYLIHRDIKPENFTTGYQDLLTIYLIDFGISRKYRSSRTGKHLKFNLIGRMFGTVRYASYNASRGVEQSRRDDLESIGYMLIYLFTGNLPWHGMSFKDKQRKKKYLEMLLLKKYTPNETICRGMPREFIKYIDYCKKLKFEEDPDYEFLRNIFRKILNSQNTINDNKFSWIFNKKYLNQMKKFYNDKKIIDIDKIKKEKYINIKLRVDSPENRLYRQIKNSLEKEKKSVANSEYLVNQNKNIIELGSLKLHQSSGSENVVQLKDNRNNSNESKSNISNMNKSRADSIVVQYDMNVDEFQDEKKMYEQNKSRIRQIKNQHINDLKKNIDINMDVNNCNLIKNRNYNIFTFSRNSQNNQKFNIKRLFEEFNEDKNIKNKLNLSLDLGFNYKKNINNNRYLLKSQEKKITKDKEKLSPTKEEMKIKHLQQELFNFIMDKIFNYIQNLRNRTQKRKQNKIPIQYKNRNVKDKNINIKDEIDAQNFSFKNSNVGKFIHDNNINIININNNKNKQGIKVEESLNKNKIKKSLLNNNININSPKNITNENIIIINTNLNSYSKFSPKTKNANIFNKKVSSDSFKSSLQPEKNINNNFKIKNNQIKNMRLKDKKKYNIKMNEINMNRNKNNIILIPKKVNNPLIDKKVLVKNNSSLKINNIPFKNMDNFITDNNINNSYMLNNTLPLKKNIKTFEYKSILNNNNNVKILNNNFKKGPKNILIKIQNQRRLKNDNIEVINLEKKRIINCKQLTKNFSYDSKLSPNKINILYKNKPNMNLLDNNKLYFNLNNYNMIPNYLNTNPKEFNENRNIKIKHYSPQNNKIINRNICHRSNSNPDINRGFNYNDNFIKMSKIGKNFNNLNNENDYKSGICYNLIKI